MKREILVFHVLQLLVLVLANIVVSLMFVLKKRGSVATPFFVIFLRLITNMGWRLLR